jgi:hypothetical protein
MNIFDMTSRESFVVEDKPPIRGYLQVAKVKMNVFDIASRESFVVDDQTPIRG